MMWMSVSDLWRIEGCTAFYVFACMIITPSLHSCVCVYEYYHNAPWTVSEVGRQIAWKKEHWVRIRIVVHSRLNGTDRFHTIAFFFFLNMCVQNLHLPMWRITKIDSRAESSLVTTKKNLSESKQGFVSFVVFVTKTILAYGGNRFSFHVRIIHQHN